MTGEVSAEDREKALGLLAAWCGGTTRSRSNLRALHALILEGWQPIGAPARPTREALARVLFSQWLGKPVEDEHWARVNAEKGEQWHIAIHRADALLAADHQWAEPDWVDPEPWLVIGNGYEQRLAHPEDNESRWTPQHMPRDREQYDHEVRAGQREKDATIAEHRITSLPIASKAIAAAIRAGCAS